MNNELTRRRYRQRTTQAQRPGPQGATPATAARWPGSREFFCLAAGSYPKALQNSFGNLGCPPATGVPFARDTGRKKDSPLSLGHATDKPAQPGNVRLGITRSARLAAEDSSIIAACQL